MIFLIIQKIIFNLVVHNINERGSEMKRVDELKDKLHISIIGLYKIGVLEPYKMSGVPDGK